MVQLQCPCGRRIGDASEFKLLFLKKELNEIDILCPNDSCYLRELGYIKFDVVETKAKFKEASFYPPFVTWNSSQLGKDEAQEALKSVLRDIVKKQIDWSKIATDKSEQLAPERITVGRESS
ncbi:MAG: hypothetical protein JTT11_05065 [Candidatus Brockarchaeota archaeon]|nr:hypothetical protein [Candidatus Brockarchaeota archaeon]